MGLATVVRVLVVDRGRVLAVEHDGDPDRIGLPGGHVRRGEALEDAAYREVEEETGLVLGRLEPLAIVQDPGRLSHVFRGWISRGQRELRSSPEGRARWATGPELLEGEHGDFNHVVMLATLRA